MNPSKIQKCEMGLASKISTRELIPPGALAKGRGQSLKVMGTLRVNAEQRTLTAKNRSYNTATSKLTKLADKNFLLHPCFDEMEDNAPLYQEAEVTQDALTSDARGQGQSLGVNAEKRTLIGKNRSSTATTSNLIKPAKKSVALPPYFCQMEYNDALYSEAEVTRDAQRNNTAPVESKRAKKVVEVARDAWRNESPFESEKAKKVAEKTKDVERSDMTVHLNMKRQNKLLKCLEMHREVILVYLNLKRQKKWLKWLEILGEMKLVHLNLERQKKWLKQLKILREVHSWVDIEEHKLEHMWAVVTEKFDSDDMNDQRYNVLQHMRKLWNNWRGSLHKNVKSKSLHEVLKKASSGVDKSDWEWLVKEHFLSDKFKETSIRNSVNRSMLRMPHRTGSKPVREIIYKLGGKDGTPPDMATIFFETRKKDNELVEPETIEKYAEIQELVQSEPSLTNIEVVERCFGPQCKSHAVGFGGGITTKELKGGTTSKVALLEELKATRKEKESLQKCMDIIESKYERLESIVVRQPPLPPSSPSPQSGSRI